MPVCRVENCNNNDRKGYRMFSLPCSRKSCRKRQEWLVNAGLLEENITTRNTRVSFCEAHFTTDCFKVINTDGWMMLKNDAVPTIFGADLPKTVSLLSGLKPHVSRDNIAPPCVEFGNQLEEQPFDGLPLSECADNDRFSVPVSIDEPMSPISKRRRAIIVCDGNVPQIDRLREAMRGMTAKRNRLQNLATQYKAKADHLSVNLSKFLNDDQIALLQLEDPSINNKEWSDSTIKTALQARLALGANGYMFLREKLMYPLPSFSCLNRCLQSLQFVPGKADEILKFLPDKVIDPKVSMGNDLPIFEEDPLCREEDPLGREEKPLARKEDPPATEGDPLLRSALGGSSTKDGLNMLL